MTFKKRPIFHLEKCFVHVSSKNQATQTGGTSPILECLDILKGWTVSEQMNEFFSLFMRSPSFANPVRESNNGYSYSPLLNFMGEPNILDDLSFSTKVHHTYHVPWLRVQKNGQCFYGLNLFLHNSSWLQGDTIGLLAGFIKLL